jgi:heme exporter protein CcmD
MKDYSFYVWCAFFITLLVLIIHGLIVWMRARRVWRNIHDIVQYQLKTPNEVVSKVGTKVAVEEVADVVSNKGDVIEK